MKASGTLSLRASGTCCARLRFGNRAAGSPKAGTDRPHSTGSPHRTGSPQAGPRQPTDRAKAGTDRPHRGRALAQAGQRACARSAQAGPRQGTGRTVQHTAVQEQLSTLSNSSAHCKQGRAVQRQAGHRQATAQAGHSQGSGSPNEWSVLPPVVCSNMFGPKTVSSEGRATKIVLFEEDRHMQPS